MSVNIDTSNIVRTNSLRIGYQLDHWEVRRFLDSQAIRDIAISLHPSLIRNFPWRNSNTAGTPDKGPCTNWNSTTHTGTFDWSDYDAFVQRVKEIGATPWICLFNGYGDPPWSRDPPGMDHNPSTGLPYPDDVKAYCKIWSQRYPGCYWDVVNEPNYMGWDNLDMTKAPAFFTFYRACYDGLKEGDPNCKVSFDRMNMKAFVDYVYANHIPFDFIDFHAYGGDNPTLTTREILDNRARWHYYGSSSRYGITELINMYKAAFSVDPEVIIGEANFSSAWETGADPRNINHEGVVYEAMVNIWSMEMGVTDRVHYTLSSRENPSYPGTYGFGIFNYLDGTPWLPYYFYETLGSLLYRGDQMYYIQETIGNLYGACWQSGSRKVLMLVNKGDTDLNIDINGLSGTFATHIFRNSGYSSFDMDIVDLSTIPSMTVIIMAEVEEPPVSVTVTIENKETGDQKVEIGQDQTVTSFVPRVTEVIAPGETKTITIQPGERLRTVE